MADRIIDADVVTKHGTASALANANPKLRAGVLCVEIDTGLIKMGDGVTYWNNLAYIGTFFPPGGQAGQVLASDGANGIKWIQAYRTYGTEGLKYGSAALYGQPYIEV